MLAAIWRICLGEWRRGLCGFSFNSLMAPKVTTTFAGLFGGLDGNNLAIIRHLTESLGVVIVHA
jgi:hypothetical protein